MYSRHEAGAGAPSAALPPHHPHEFAHFAAGGIGLAFPCLGGLFVALMLADLGHQARLLARFHKPAKGPLKRFPIAYFDVRHVPRHLLSHGFDNTGSFLSKAKYNSKSQQNQVDNAFAGSLHATPLQSSVQPTVMMREDSCASKEYFVD